MELFLLVSSLLPPVSPREETGLGFPSLQIQSSLKGITSEQYLNSPPRSFFKLGLNE